VNLANASVGDREVRGQPLIGLVVDIEQPEMVFLSVPSPAFRLVVVSVFGRWAIS
jgi:hypothetical protein